MTTTNNEVQKPDDATLILRRTLNAPRELAFKAWTSAEHIQQWMRPEPGMMVPSAIMDLRMQAIILQAIMVERFENHLPPGGVMPGLRLFATENAEDGGLAHCLPPDRHCGGISR